MVEFRPSPTVFTPSGALRRRTLAAERYLCMNISLGWSRKQRIRVGGVKLTLRRNLGAAPAIQGAPMPPQRLQDGARLLLEL